MRGGTRHWTMLVALVVALTGSATGSVAMGARQAPLDPGLDLAAVTIRPGDLEEPGWVHEGAFIEQLAGEAAGYAAYLGGGESVEAVIETLSVMGWERKYVHSLALPSPASSGLPPQRIRSYVTEYATPEGAAEGFAFFEDERPIESATDIPATRTFGEESELTEDRGVSGIDGRHYRSLDLTFRTGNLVAGVTLIIYENAVLASPTGDMIEALAGLLESRITEGVGDGVGLGTMVVRLAPAESAIVTFDDAYYRFDGEDAPQAGESPTDAIRRVETYAGATEVYQLWQGINTGTSTGLLYGVTLLRFPDEQAAAGWVTDLAAILAANPFYRAFQPITGAPPLGDQTNALSYSAGGDANAPRAVLVAVRVGHFVARLHLVPQGWGSDVPADPVIELAAAQAACLTGETCEPIGTLPAALLVPPSPRAAPNASPVAATPESA